MTEDEQQEDEYVNRKFIYHLDVKNNIGIPTKFSGTQNEFDIKYKEYLGLDTYGKIIGITKSEYISKPEVVEPTIKHNRWGEDVNGLNRSNTNKRYWKYL